MTKEALHSVQPIPAVSAHFPPTYSNARNTAQHCWSSAGSGLYIAEFLLRQSFERTQEEGWDGEGAAIFLLAKSSLRRSTVHTADWVLAVSQCICVCVPVCACTRLLSRSVYEHRAGLCSWSVAGLRADRGLRRLSHGYKSSLLEQWLELTAVPVTYSTGLTHSSDALCHSPCGGLLQAF